MSRTGVLRLLQRLPGAAFPEASIALKAAASSHGLTTLSFESGLQGSQSFKGFNAQMIRPQQLSFASQLHTLTTKDEERTQVASAVAEKRIPSALTALPPRAQRGMASAAGGRHLEVGEAHPYHILPPSPWPFMTTYSIMLSALGMAGWFHCIPHMDQMMYLGVATTLGNAIAWWRDCYIEADLGMHTEVQKNNLVNGVWVFIASEATLFFGLLWACVHLGMAPNVYQQMQWPPVGIDAIGWEGRALVMSAVLAASYYSANVAMVAKDPKVVLGALGTTVGLGALFLADQYLEYSTTPFTITDGAYGTTFYITTGFHGFHVLVGSVWLASAMLNYARDHKANAAGIRGGVLYWHFVDIVWIAVYGIIYAAQL